MGCYDSWQPNHLNQLRQRVRQGQDEVHFFLGSGMQEVEFAGVEAEAAGGISGGAVGLVTDDGVAHVGEVDADLMAASGFQL